MEDTLHIQPWIGSTSCKKVLTILILSRNVEILEKLSKYLVKAHSKGRCRWQLIIFRSLDIREILRNSHFTGAMGIDFVVLAIDTMRLNSMMWVEENYESLHPDLKRRRVILVNPTGLPINAMSIPDRDFLVFHKEHRLDLLNADVTKPDEAESLAQKILKYVEVSVGVLTGLPNLNI